jgi:hypothetical protein
VNSDLIVSAWVLTGVVALGCAASFVIWEVRDGGLTHLARTALFLARYGRIPRWLKALIVFGCLPIIGPLDEVVLLVAGVILWIGYRERLKWAWDYTSNGGPS